MIFEGERGASLPLTEYVKTTPRRWTAAETRWLETQKENGMSVTELAKALDRSEVSVSVKLTRLQKTNDKYNHRFREKKYLANHAFLESIEPKSVLDLYAGHSFWKPLVERCVTNDTNTDFDTDHHKPAFDFLCELYLQRQRFDLIDLDPFGSAYECLDLSCRLANKGLIVSFGEWGHYRWQRLDFVQSRYGIDSLDDWSVERFTAEVIRIARTHKKRATVVDSLNYGNFLRVYFELEQFKETSQWEKQ